MIKKLSYKSSLFSLKIRQASKAAVIDMTVHGQTINTYDIPHTINFLEEYYPRVLNTQCFNEKNLPFATEVKQTEIGHLFEHILIDNLCALKIKSGAKSAVFNGVTSWNWKENPYGTFQIWVDSGRNDFELLVKGLKVTIDLTKKLMTEASENKILRATSSLDHPQKVI